MEQRFAPASRPVVPVTVVIPAFNAARFIARTLRMLDDQTVRPAEVIVVDDGSADDTAAIAERMAAHVIRAPHAGLSATRNAGIAAAANDWIALLDADDIWDPRKLELQWDVSRANPGVNLIATDYDEIDPFGSVLLADAVLGLRQYCSLTARRVTPNAMLMAADALAGSLPEWGLFLPSSVLFNRELVREIGGFDSGVKSEDSEFFLRCVARSQAIVIERPLLGYVRHPSQITATSTRDHVALDLCERVIEAPQRYHRASVEAFRKRLPVLLLRHARLEARSGRYRQAAAHAGRAVATALSPAVAIAIGAGLALRNPALRRLLAPFPGARSALARTPGRAAAREERADRPQWSAIIARANGAPDPRGAGDAPAPASTEAV